MSYQQSSDLLQELKTTPHQWRSEAKCRPGPTIKVSPFPVSTPSICLQEFKMKEDHASCLSKI